MIRALSVVLVMLLLAGCRAEEQGRPVSFEPGTYRGEKPMPLTDQQVQYLRERGNLMR